MFNFLTKFNLSISGGGQPQWQNRYPPPGPGGYPPQGPPVERTWAPPAAPGAPPRGPVPGPQWSNDRTSYYGPSGPAGGPGSWGPMSKGPMVRPPYRPDMRGPQRPVSPNFQHNFIIYRFISTSLSYLLKSRVVFNNV